jgi:hypothetical protein
MATRETGKQRRSRIPLEYYKQRDALARTKKWLAVVAALAALSYWGTGWLSGGDVGRLRYSRGDLAAVHATWDANCLACHEPATPVDRKNWLFDTWFARLVGEPGSMDAKCKSCHSGAAHSQNEKDEERASCAHCHRDHRGRDAAIARVADHECIACHADLKSHRADGGSLADASLAVTGFGAGEHPDFSRKSIPENGKDPGRLKFNHERHMKLGESYSPEVFKAQLIDPRDKEEFDRRFGSDRIELSCDTCHQLDPGDFQLESVARRLQARAQFTRPSGEYMVPITYDNQCRLCHPLSYAENEPPLPHGVQPPELRQFIEGVFTKQFLSGNAPWLDEPVPTRPVPGRAPDEHKESARKTIADQVAIKERLVFESRCDECHYPKDDARDASGSEPERSIAPTAVPTVWLRHAKFSHMAHRAVDCKACHDDVSKSTSNADVLFKKIDVCQECHAPPGGSTPGGARHDCAECHSYHNGDHPLAGLGAAARDEAHDRSIRDFLSGTSTGRSATAPAKP